MHNAFYLKYRPQTLDNLIGQDEVKKTLLASFQNNKLTHAYLFVGPRGTGKTSTARILAKMVNCESLDSAPCNKCATCLSITDGSNLDLIEIDAASNRGIEDIRSLREKIKLSPTKNKKKVYIIDEVHMLTTEAFNALLKTLEEPPSHALFILATTEIGKIPQTILSRVQRLDFKLASSGQLLEALQRIVVAEKMDIDEEALKILVKRADGSFRDGVKLLDQISSLGGKINAKSLEENLKVLQFDELLDLIKSFSEKNIEKGLLSVSKQIENGVDIKELILSLMDTLRNLIFIKNGLGEQLVKSQFMENKYDDLVKAAESLSNRDLVRCLDLLQEAIEKLKFASIPALPLELAIVGICGENPELKVQSVDLKPQKMEQPVVQANIVVQQMENLPQEPVIENKEPSMVDDATNPDLVKLKEKWTFVLETVRPFNFSLEALLRAINVTGCTEAAVIMEVPYAFHQRILEAPKNRDLLESILSDILGRTIKVSTVLGNRPSRTEDIANVEVAADDEIIRAAAEIFNSDVN